MNSLVALKDNPHIVQIQNAVCRDDKCYLILEQCFGDMASIVQKNLRISEKLAKLYFPQMAEGLWESHHNKVYHHDVKLENFLIGKDGSIKLADFGHSLFLDDKQWTVASPEASQIRGRYSAGSPAYSSYQVLRKHSHSGVLNDIYGLGICFYRLLCGKFPFCNPEKDTKETLIHNVRRSADQTTIYFPHFVSAEARELICGMIALHEEDRWGWEEIMAHPWFLNAVFK